MDVPTYSPREIVSELDRFIVGQGDAKRAVAIALRNRWRRQQLPDGLREEVVPKNILMIGPTGCGKTEIARRLARLAQAPFLKVEATKFTEVGYVGRDVESIVRDLVEASIAMLRDSRRKEVQAKAELAAEERILTALCGEQASADTRSKFRRMLRNGDFEDKEIEISLTEAGPSPIGQFDMPGMPPGQMINLGEMMKALGGANAAESADISITAPDIAQNGAVVPVGVTSKVPGTQAVYILVDKNPSLLAASFNIPQGTEANVSTRIKMGQTSDVLALVRANDKYFLAKKEVKVTLGGCGG